jgi:hypothetical protein
MRICSRVLFDAETRLVPGIGVDALREEPDQSDLCWCCTRLGGNDLDFVDDPCELPKTARQSQREQNRSNGEVTETEHWRRKKMPGRPISV